jgi:hypothetical protein
MLRDGYLKVLLLMEAREYLMTIQRSLQAGDISLAPALRAVFVALPDTPPK